MVLAPCSEALFLSETLGQGPLHVPGPRDKFSHLVSWTIVNDILSRGGLTFPQLRMINGGQELHPRAFYRADSRGIPRLLLGEVNSLLQEGTTLAIEPFEQLHGPVTELSHAVEYSLGVPVEVSLEVACCDGTCSGKRWNDHDVIVLQITGDTQWTSFGVTRRFPTALDRPEEPTGKAERDYVLHAGDLLYLPRGWWHVTTRINEPMLRLTLKFRIPTGIDIATRILDRLNSIEFMRMDYPLFAGAATQSKYLTRIQSEIVRECNQPGLILDFFNDMRASAEPVREFSLPWGARSRHQSLPDDFVIVPLTRFPVPNLAVHGRRLAAIVHRNARALSDEQMEAIIECLLGTPLLTVQLLMEKLNDTISRERLSEVLSRLLDHGAVALRPPSDC
jgi:hypothetical protein